MEINDRMALAYRATLEALETGRISPMKATGEIAAHVYDAFDELETYLPALAALADYDRAQAQAVVATVQGKLASLQRRAKQTFTDADKS